MPTRLGVDLAGYHHVKRGYVDEGEHWRYSSARDYEGLE